jgi:FKBP-type peptidyl-prolyl cis-trans isomerase
MDLRSIRRSGVLILVVLAAGACGKSAKSPPPPARTPPAPQADRRLPRVAPPDPNAPPDVKAVPADAQTSPGGLAFKVLKPGAGKDRPKASDTVTVHYTGWMTNGRKFDSSVDRKQPATFPLNQVIKGWSEGLQLMVVGEKRRFWIPPALAYGDKPRRPGAASGLVVFDMELVSIVRPPTAPSDVAKVPRKAKKTKSGLAYRVLAKGEGRTHPRAADTVEVHYSGWTAEGKLFDSSVTRGRPATLALNGVIPGWTEAVQLMVVGEKTRFWIPEEMAYGDKPTRPGAPAGSLVFDVELLAIK